MKRHSESFSPSSYFCGQLVVCWNPLYYSEVKRGDVGLVHKVFTKGSYPSAQVYFSGKEDYDNRRVCLHRLRPVTREDGMFAIVDASPRPEIVRLSGGQ